MAVIPGPPPSEFRFFDKDNQKWVNLESRELHTFLFLLWKLLTGNSGPGGSVPGPGDAVEDSLAFTAGDNFSETAALNARIADLEGHNDFLQSQISALKEKLEDFEMGIFPIELMGQERANENELALTTEPVNLASRVEELEDLVSMI